MSDASLRELFAAQLEKNNEPGLASRVRDGSDNSHGGIAALAAMTAAVDAERKRCAAIVNAARHGEVDGDFRCLRSMIEGGEPIEALIKQDAK